MTRCLKIALYKDILNIKMGIYIHVCNGFFFTSTRKITRVDCKQILTLQIRIRFSDPWTIKEKLQIFRIEFE